MTSLDITRDALVLLIKDGESITGIAQRYGRSRGWVSNRIAELCPEMQPVIAENARRKSSMGSSKLLSAPAGFAEDAKSMTITELTVKHKAARQTIIRWRNECGVRYQPPRQIPEEVNTLAETMTVAELAEYFGYSRADTFGRALGRDWPEALARARQNKPKPVIPEGFAMEARSMTISAAAKRWSVQTRTIRKLAEAHGDGLLEAMEANGRIGSAMPGRRTGRLRRKPDQQRVIGLDDALLDYIRLKTRQACYSSRIYGEHKNVYYIVGAKRFDLAALLDFGKKLGFQPEGFLAQG